MKKENKKLLAFFVAAVIISSVIASVLFFGYKTIEEGSSPGLNVKIFADQTEGIAPITVNFTSIVTNEKGNIEYSWDFGNGITSKEMSPMVVFDEPKEYTVSLKVNDENDQKDADNIKIIAKKNKAPIVTLSINQNTINRKFNFLSILSLLPVFGYAGNQQLILDQVEEKKGANAWGEGRIVVTAQISDPEDDEIVSYEWKEQTSDTLVTWGGDELLPTHNLTGNENVTIPELYTWMANRHVVTLTVTDSAGNKAQDNIEYTVSQSKKKTDIDRYRRLIFTGLLTTLPSVMQQAWQVEIIQEIVTEFLDEQWLDWPPSLQFIVSFILNFIRWDYEPPVPKADLIVTSDINEVNLSSFVNESGVVDNPDAEDISSFVLMNNDTENTARSIYLTLAKPFSEEKGLNKTIEVEDLILYLGDEYSSNTLFYNGKYTDWSNSYYIEKLAPGDLREVDITVKLKEGAKFEKGSYECKLYIYQEKYLDKEEYVDDISFTITI